MKKLQPITAYYLRDAVWALNSGLIFNSLWVFYIEGLRLSMVQLSLIFVVISVTVLLFEVPTGIVADVYGRRLSVIIGGVFIGLCYTLTGLLPFFWVALLAAFIEAIGDTFVSGALQAWITDEVSANNVGPVFLRSQQISTVAHWVGILMGVVLAARFGYLFPVLLGGLSWFVLSAVLILLMPETKFVRCAAEEQGVASLQQSARGALAIFVEGTRLVRGSPTLVLLFIAQMFIAIFADSFYKLSRAHFLRGLSLPTIAVPFIGALKDNAWFGIFDALQGAFGLLSAEAVRRTINLNNSRVVARTLVGFYGAVVVGVVVFAITGQFVVAVGAWLVITVLNQLAEPIINTWLNQNIPSEVRATVLSMGSQLNMAGTLGGGPAIGAASDRFGLRAGLVLTSLLLVPVIALYGRRISHTTGFGNNNSR